MTDIPDAAIEAAAEAMADLPAGAIGAGGFWDAHARAAIEAAMPAIREAIAQAVEADRDAIDWNKSYRNGMDHAVSIVRGAQ